MSSGSRAVRSTDGCSWRRRSTSSIGKNMILGERFDFGGTPPAMGSCAGVPNCWNDGSFDPNGRIYNRRVTFINGPRINAGTGDLKGIELEASLRATDRWSFRTTLALQDSQYAENCDFSGVNTYGFTSDCTTAAGTAGLQVGGNAIEGTNAETQATLSAIYVAPLGGNWLWSSRLSVHHKGENFLDVINYATIPDATTATGQIGFNNDNWNIMLYGNNLTDEDSVLVVRELRELALGGDPNSWRYIPRLPREIGLRVNFSFLSVAD